MLTSATIDTTASAAATDTPPWPEVSGLPALRAPGALVTQRVLVQGCPHPFRNAQLRAEVPAGMSVRECLRMACALSGWSPRFLRQARVWLDDLALPPAHWDRVRPKAGARLTFRAFTEGPAIALIAAIAISIGASAAGAAAAAGLGLTATVAGVTTLTALGTVVATTITVLISAVGMLLLQMLMPASKPSLPGSSGLAVGGAGDRSRATSPTYAIQAPRNAVRAWDPIPSVLGLHRQTPPYAALPYTEIVGDDQYVRLLLCWGYGPIQVTDLKIGDTPLSDFRDVEVETRPGFADDAPITLYPGQVFEDTLNVELLQTASWQQRTTATQIDEISLDYTFPNGLGQVDTGTGEMLNASVNVEAQYRQDFGAGSFSDWVTVLASGAEITVAAQTFWLNPAHEANPQQDPGSIGSRVWLNADTLRLELVEGPLKPLNQQDFPAIPAHCRSIARVTVSAGNITQVVQELHADLTGFTATSGTGLRQLDVAQGTYTSGAATFEGAQSEVYRRTIAWKTGVRGDFQVRTRRVTLDSTSTYVHDDCHWTALRGFRHDPVVTFPTPLALTAIRLRATEQLNGVPDDINGLCAGLARHWTGSAWVEQPTSNPASLFRHILQGPANATPLTDAELDLVSLQAWAAYCATEGYSYNAVHDFRASLWETLLDVAAAGRAFIVHKDGQWGVAVEEQVATAPPAQHFTPRNSWGFQANRAYREVPHAWRVRFLNAAEGWRSDERFVYDDGYSAANATRVEQLEFPGVTDPELIWKHGRYRLAELTLRPELYSFNADVEHLLCGVGDRIRVAHDVTLWGLAQGRVVSVDTLASQVTMDEPMPMTTDSYQIRFRLQDGSSLVRGVQTAAGQSPTLTLTTGSGFPQEGDLGQFGVLDLESVDLLVSRIEPAEDLTARLTCVDLAPAIYSADTGPIPDWDPQVTTPIDFRDLPPALPVITSVRSDANAVRWADDGTMIRSILATARPGQDSVPVAYFEWRWKRAIQRHWRTENLPWEEALRLEPVRRNQLYQLQVRAVSFYELPSEWAATTHLVTALSLPGNPPTDVIARNVQHFIYVSWTNPADPDFSHVEARISPSSDFNHPSATSGGTHRHMGLLGPFAPGTRRWIWLRAVNRTGQVSAWAGPVVGRVRYVHASDLARAVKHSNLVFNPSAEDYDVDTLEAFGWQTENGGTLEIPLVSITDRADGLASLIVGAPTRAMSCRAMPVTPGDLYAISLKAKGASATGAGLYIRVHERTSYPEDGDYVTSANQTSYTDLAANVAVPSAWTRGEYTYTAPAGVLFVSLAVYNWTGGPASLLVDEVEVHKKLTRLRLGAGIVDTPQLNPGAVTSAILSQIAPSTPTGLAATTGVLVGSDGVISAWVRATWTANPESDIAGYRVRLELATSGTPLTQDVLGAYQACRFEGLPANVAASLTMAAVNQRNVPSPLSSPVALTTGQDTTAPAAASGLSGTGHLESVALLWTIPADDDYRLAQVWSSTTNDRATAAQVGEGYASFVHTGLPGGTPRYYWVRTVDSTGNAQHWHPASATAGVSVTPLGVTVEDLSDPTPATPTGLALTTGTTLQSDGTVIPWVQAQWNDNAETNVERYQVDVRFGASTVRTTLLPSLSEARLENVPGNVTCFVRVAAITKFGTFSSFTGESSITTGQDSTAPGAPSGLTAVGSFRSNRLLWTPPGDDDYLHCQVRASQTNDYNTTSVVGSGYQSFVHSGLSSAATWYYWLVAVDASGNLAAAFPPNQFGGVGATTVQTQTADLAEQIVTSGKLIPDLRSPASNGDFEAGNVDWRWLGPQWEIVNVGSSVARSGSWVARKNAGSTDTEIVHANYIRVEAGQQLYAHAWYKAAGSTAGTVSIRIYWFNAQKATLSAPEVVGPALSSGTWQQAASLFIAPAGAQYANVAVVVRGVTTQAIWVDDVTVLTAVTANLIGANIVAANHLRTDTAVISVAAQIANAIIGNAHIADLSADKITAGILDVLVQLGVGNKILLDGPNELIYVRDANGTNRVVMGKLGAGGTDWGLRVYNSAGVLMWDLTGAAGAGIQDGVITAQKLSVGTIGDNLIANPSAEAGTEGWAQVQATGGAPPGFLRDSADRTEGSACFLIGAASATNGAGYGYRAIPVVPGDRYTVRLKLRAALGNASAQGLYLRVDHRSAYPASGDHVTLANRDGGTELAANAAIPANWTLYEYTYTAPAGAFWATLSVFNWVNGGISGLWFDEVECRKQLGTVHIEDGAITASKVTTGSLITQAAQIGNALITDAHISNLTAGKITSGTLAATNRLFIGPAGVNDQLTLDGVGSNRRIFLLDEAGVTRLILGRFVGAPNLYGLRVWDSAGNLMWDVTDGATSYGLKNASVTDRYAATGLTGALTVAAGETTLVTTSIGGTFQSGHIIAFGRINVTLAAGAALLLVIRRASTIGAIIASQILTNPLGGATSYQFTVSGEDGTPAWSGNYLLRATAIAATATINSSDQTVYHTKK